MRFLPTRPHPGAPRGPNTLQRRYRRLLWLLIAVLGLLAARQWRRVLQPAPAPRPGIIVLAGIA